MVKNKWIKRLIILIIAIVLSIGVQTGILYFVRSYYIASDLNMEVADYKKATTIKKQIEVSGIAIKSVEDVTPIPHNGTRPPKRILKRQKRR